MLPFHLMQGVGSFFLSVYIIRLWVFLMCIGIGRTWSFESLNHSLCYRVVRTRLQRIATGRHGGFCPGSGSMFLHGAGQTWTTAGVSIALAGCGSSAKRPRVDAKHGVRRQWVCVGHVGFINHIFHDHAVHLKRPFAPVLSSRYGNIEFRPNRPNTCYFSRCRMRVQLDRFVSQVHLKLLWKVSWQLWWCWLLVFGHPIWLGQALQLMLPEM